MIHKFFLVLCSILIFSFPVIANLRFNEQSQVFYSEGARKNVNFIEYHNLVVRWIEFSDANPYYNVDNATCVALKALGTPAALRLIHDIKKIYKSSKKIL